MLISLGWGSWSSILVCSFVLFCFSQFQSNTANLSRQREFTDKLSCSCFLNFNSVIHISLVASVAMKITGLLWTIGKWFPKLKNSPLGVPCHPNSLSFKWGIHYNEWCLNCWLPFNGIKGGKGLFHGWWWGDYCQFALVLVTSLRWLL